MLEGPNIKMNSGRAKIQNIAGIKSVIPTINDRRINTQLTHAHSKVMTIFSSRRTKYTI